MISQGTRSTIDHAPCDFAHFHDKAARFTEAVLLFGNATHSPLQSGNYVGMAATDRCGDNDC